MNRSLFTLALAFVATCATVQADGFAWPGTRPTLTRLPVTRLIGAFQDGQVAPAAPAQPMVESPTPTAYDGYPFTSRCCENTNSCCDGIWSGYSRSCGCGHRLFGLHHHGGSCGCCPYGGGCYANSFSGAGCGGGHGWGLLHGWHGCGCGHGLGHLGHLFHRHGCGLALGCGVSSGCSDCASGSYNGSQPVYKDAPAPPVPTPALDTSEKAAFRSRPMLGIRPLSIW
jgi:hypothetical protein